MTFNDELFCPAKSIGRQWDVLREDMFQAELQNGWILDLGWSPCHRRSGRFRLQVVKERDWGNPVFAFTSRDFSAVEAEVKRIVAMVAPEGG